MFFQIHSALVPHLLVPSNAAVRHCLVVYASTVNLLIFFWFVMDTLHYYFYVPLHGDMDFLSGTGPIKCESNVYFPFPVFFYLIVFFELTYEAVGMLFALVFYSKVIHYQGETYLTPFVFT